MKKLYLHLGMTKTGTTSIQRTARKYADVLLDHGIYYPYFTLSDSNCDPATKGNRKIFNHGGPIFSIFCEKPLNFRYNKLLGLKDIDVRNKKWIDELNQILDVDHDIFLSGEQLSTLSVDEMNQMFNYFNSFECEVVCLLLVRSPYQHVVSSIQQRIKLGSHIPWLTLGNLYQHMLGIEINDLIFARFLKPIITCLECCGSSLKVLSYEELCSSELGLTRMVFRDFLGFEEKICNNINEVFANESFSNLTIRLQNQFNKRSSKLIPGVGGKNLSHFEFPADLGKSEKFLLTQDEFDCLSKSLEICEEKLCSILGSNFVDRRYKLSNPISDDDLLDSLLKYFK